MKRNQEHQELPRMTNTYFSKQFELVNDELREHFGIANNEIENVREKVNELVAIVHEDNPTWSIKKICAYIAGVNSDLESLGFSAKTIFNYLNEENRQLIDSSKKPKNRQSKSLKDFRDSKGTKSQNNVTEDDVETFQHQVPEDSSRTISSSDQQIGEAVDTVYDIEYNDQTPEKLISGVVDTIHEQKQEIDWKAKYEELEITYSNAISPYEDKGSIFLLDGQEIPITAKADPYKRLIDFEIDQKELKKLKRF